MENNTALPFLSDPKYSVSDKFFVHEDSIKIWKYKKARDRVYKGTKGLKKHIAKPMNELDNNVKVEIVMTGKYAKLSCSTPGCRL